MFSCHMTAAMPPESQRPDLSEHTSAHAPGVGGARVQETNVAQRDRVVALVAH